MFVSFIFSKNQLLVSLIFSIGFLVSISFVFALIFIISFLPLTLGFVLFFFFFSPSFLRHKLKAGGEGDDRG